MCVQLGNRKFFLILITVLICSKIYGEFNYVPESTLFIKTGNTIKNLCWNTQNTSFAYTEGDLVFIRDSSTFSLIKSIEIPNIETIMFSKEGSLENDVLLTLTKDGQLATYNISKLNQKSISLNYNDLNTPPNQTIKTEKITAISFSQNSNYIALADSQNIITIIFKLRFTNETIAYKSLEHENTIYNIVFSPNTWYFATASKDNTIKLYSTDISNNLKSITSIPFYSNLNANFDFTLDSKNIICSTKENELTVFNLKGEKQYSIKTANPISKLRVLQNSSLVAVQTTKNQIELYDLSAKEYLGYIPSYNSSLLTAFSFSAENDFLLLGYEDGSIYRIDAKKNFLKPGENPPEVKLLSESEMIVPSTGYFDSNSVYLLTQKDNVIVPKLGIGFLTHPFLINLSLKGEYKNFKLFSPIYIGGGMKLNCGFPRKDFPYHYIVNDEIQANPVILGGNIFVSSGFSFSPGKKDFFIYLGFNIGPCLYSLGYFPDQGYLITNPHIGFSAAIQLGGYFKGFDFNIEINYDTVNKFYPEIAVGYQIKLKGKEKTKDE